MESLIISFNAIVPMFLIIAIGYTFKSIGWITPAEVKRFNKIVFHTFMSAMLFRSIYNSDLPLRYNNDKQKKPLFSRGLSVCRLLFNSFSKLKIDENYKEKRRLFY